MTYYAINQNYNEDKNSFSPVRISLSGNNYIKIVPSIGDTHNTLVFKYSTDDSDIVIHFDAKHINRIMPKFNACATDFYNVGELISTIIFYNSKV